MKVLSYLLIVCILCVGCNIPQRVIDDIEIVKSNSNLIHSFNEEFINRAKIVNEAELEKKIQLMMACGTSYKRLGKAIRMLSEYLASSEIMSEKQLAVTNDLINQIAAKILEKVDFLKENE